MDYDKIINYFLPLYLNAECKIDRQFVPETEVKIIGVHHYKPYNVPEVKKFRNFFKK